MHNVRADFPLLAKHPSLVYFDSACTALKPREVIDAETAYYSELGACSGRSAHGLARKTNELIDTARATVAQFVGARPEELIWTRNATEALNLVAHTLPKGGKVVTTNMEHHSALLPFMRLRDRGEIELNVIRADGNGEIIFEAWERAIDKKTALVVTNNGTNTTGARQDVKKIAKLAHDHGAQICIDGAQGVPHHAIDFKKADIDFLCFSGHKMLGPTGIGALVAKKEHLDKREQFLVGGGTVHTVTLEKFTILNDNSKFEAGIQNYAGIAGFKAACEYLKRLGMENVGKQETLLAEALLNELQNAHAITYGSTGTKNKSALFSFTLKNAKPHEIALHLDKDNIAVRSGYFCAQPAMEALGAKDGAVRASLYIYNTLDEVRQFGEALQKIAMLYG